MPSDPKSSGSLPSGSGPSARRKQSAAKRDDRPLLTIAEERAAAQRRQRELRAERRAELDVDDELLGSGRVLRTSLLVVTAAHTVLTLGAIIWLDALQTAAAVASLVLFGLGLLLFPVALWRGARRSRDAELTMAGWFLLSGSAPRRVRLELVGSTAVLTAVPLLAAAIHPFTRLAFGILVPTLGLAVCGMWGARYGRFPPPAANRRAR